MISAWIASLVLKYGKTYVLIGGLVSLLILLFGISFGIAKFKAWYYQNKVERVQAELSVQKQNVKVLQQDAKQADKAIAIEQKTVAKQDSVAIKQRANTNKSVKVINERIKQVPVSVEPAIDSVVFAEVLEARTRAQASSRKLSGTQSP